MKIRWTKDSVRLRISPAELEALVRGEQVIEDLEYSGGGWAAILSVSSSQRQTELVFARGDLQLIVSRADLERLRESETEGMYFGSEAELGYCVEKDFPCAHPRPGQEASADETFPAPEGFGDRNPL